jgi:hypothetical protein
MEGDDDYARAMIEGRLRTVKDMRRQGSGVLEIEKLESAIEALERSQEMLLEALDPGAGKSFGLDPDKVQEYLSDVMNELEILQAQRSAIYAELPVRPPAPVTVDPPFPSRILQWLPSPPNVITRLFTADTPNPDKYADSTLKFLVGTNVARLLARTKHWNAGYGKDCPDPNVIYRIYFTQLTITFNEAREYVKRVFWRDPEWRIEIAYLVYHYYCTTDIDTTKSSAEFRVWLVQVLNMAVTPSAYPTILASLSRMGTFRIEDVKVPFHSETEAFLLNLLWMSYPSSEQIPAEWWKLREHYDSHHLRLQQLAITEYPQ